MQATIFTGVIVDRTRGAVRDTGSFLFTALDFASYGPGFAGKLKIRRFRVRITGGLRVKSNG